MVSDQNEIVVEPIVAPEESTLTPKIIGPLFKKTKFEDIKDPCPVFDGERWHIYGSGGAIATETWSIFHATARKLDGIWQEEDTVILSGVHGSQVAAPGVIYDAEERAFHMFVQTVFLDLNGSVKHLVSTDGKTFDLADTVFESLSGSGEACIYDPHPAIVGGDKYLTYSGAAQVGHPDIYLARSTSGSWHGPWERLGKILDQSEVLHHNQMGDPDYEWGLEGSQLVELPGGKCLLNIVCFLPGGERGSRQRVFFAVADSPMGPFSSIGTVIEPSLAGWDSGENGHASGIVVGDKFVLFYQARPRSLLDGEIGLMSNPISSHWNYGIATFDLQKILRRAGWSI